MCHGEVLRRHDIAFGPRHDVEGYASPEIYELHFCSTIHNQAGVFLVSEKRGYPYSLPDFSDMHGSPVQPIRGKRAPGSLTTMSGESMSMLKMIIGKHLDELEKV